MRELVGIAYHIDRADAVSLELERNGAVEAAALGQQRAGPAIDPDRAKRARRRGEPADADEEAADAIGRRDRAARGSDAPAAVGVERGIGREQGHEIAQVTRGGGTEKLL